jgi:dihydropteroate synthase type 2
MKILGIVNITPDSFSDGGKFFAPEDAIAQARKLIRDGADIVDLGPASSNPDAAEVSPEEEIRRLVPVLLALKKDGVAISVDSFQPKTQLFALESDVAVLNDIQGFPHAAIYPQLSAARAKLIVMHSVQGRGKARREEIPVTGIWDRITAFFDSRITELTAAGISRERIILDPGMGFFLSSNPDVSVLVLKKIRELKEAFRLPVLISVSRKSFLRKLTGKDVAEIGPATLAAELFAAAEGADYIRTHDAGALAQALTVEDHLRKSGREVDID